MLVGMPLLQVLDRLGCGGIILSTGGQVLAVNSGAQRILQETFGLADPEVENLDGDGREFVKRLLRRGRTRIPVDEDSWILMEREGKRPLIMNATPVPVLSADGPHTVLMLLDLDAAPQANRLALERIFRLTPTESRLATMLANGATLAEAAEAQDVSVATARTQLKAIFAKTHTHRQAELVMLISRLSALPW
ncbi:hypothetical protein MTDSW087_05666 [Methylobacterium dankookense]|uniref:HTH luxR-type domain-containing protein n=2 Tax=Methylobacterium dankookense TaxID=560405 RepID=A0A564G6F0_9HYPH|nr:hypothetical protein IFDJLNFL_2143 [Methylobacterium dankookense]VUF15917.1 hypothetical protein MTDSW087_05666 [Methylobacterium dankookense]